MSTEKPDMTRLLGEITASKWIVEDDAPKKRLPPWGARIPRHFVIIGTSGSHDYLKDTTGGQRFWPISGTTRTPAPNETRTPPTLQEAELVKRLLALTPDVPVRVLKNSYDEDDEVRHTEDL